jgi:hypothetical protein
VFQDGSDRLPTDSPQTPSTTTGHPPAETPRFPGTDDSPRRLNDATETGPGADRVGLPRSADGPTPSGSITPTPKRGPPSPNASDRRQTGRGAPRAESAPVAERRRRRRGRPTRRADDADRRSTDELNPTRGLCGPLRLPLNGFTYC